MTDEVIAYTDPHCPHCRRLKQYLERHHVQYQNRDVTQDEEAAEELQKMGAEGVPVTRIGEDVIIGFDEARIGDALRGHGVLTSA